MISGGAWQVRRRAAGRLAGMLLAMWTVSSLALVGCGQDAADPPAEKVQETPAVPATEDAGLTDSVLLLTFDETSLTYDGIREFPDAEGRSNGLVETANDGNVELTAGAAGRGQALRFPAVCAVTEGCPRAMVAIAHEAALDPAEKDFSYGAGVLLPADQTAQGSNIVQKGRFGSSGGQWKLQVDTLDGKPSCVVRGEASLLAVRSTESIADGQWHDVMCTKDDSGVSIEVDGTPTFERGEIGTVTNDFPISVGSPGIGDRDDQFHGVLDDVFLTIEDVAGD